MVARSRKKSNALLGVRELKALNSLKERIGGMVSSP